MLPQRKVAWSDRKKKPKSEMALGKCGINHGKDSSYPANRFHKTSSCRPHESRKMSYCEVTCSSLARRGPSGVGRTLKKNTMAQSQFLPPIKSMGTDGCLSNQSCLLLGETLSGGHVDEEGWRSSTFSRNPDNFESGNQGDSFTPISSSGCIVSLITGSWEHKTFGLEDLVTSAVKKAENPDLHGSCLLVLTSRSSGGKDLKAQQMFNLTRRTVGQSQRCLNWNKTTRRGLSTWRSSEEPNVRKKAVEKRSSGDSAFGTDTWSESAEVDIELGLELNTLEMDHYTHQRIINWILQVNAALFSPHTAETLTCPLTEQDTSIKIVYDGD
ncbi:uncharacterized protein [Dendrobates tinctorius]|uniref:uncharacterized protein n=1 Tax=Dendrobates tinctorius TaxID=92724 RepID=UPI003CCA24AB